jgi:hypothetical protein
MSLPIEVYLPYYLGCDTTLGRLTGLCPGIVFTQSEKGDILEHDSLTKGFQIKLILRKLNSLSDDQSRQLIAKGFSIGRPKGYSFSPEAFLYLFSLQVDLFGLIDSGLAIDISTMDSR